MTGAKSRKYQEILEVKSRVQPWHVRGIWSQQLKHKTVPKGGTEPDVRKGELHEGNKVYWAKTIFVISLVY